VLSNFRAFVMGFEKIFLQPATSNLQPAFLGGTDKLCLSVKRQWMAAFPGGTDQACLSVKKHRLTALR
jgi:hypothetical protein